MRNLLGWTAILVAGFATLNAGQRVSAAGDEGRQLFVTYCASCHGTSGHGDGPAADILRVRPANLTQLAWRNGAVFPTARTERVIDGRDVGAHGNPAMPVWGDAFKRREDLAHRATVDEGEAFPLDTRPEQDSASARDRFHIPILEHVHRY